MSPDTAIARPREERRRRFVAGKLVPDEFGHELRTIAQVTFLDHFVENNSVGKLTLRRGSEVEAHHVP
jgi:hypothetical protein